MQETTKNTRFVDRTLLFGLRVLLLACALLAGAYVSEGVLESWQAGSQSPMAK